jgi:formylglycine-generating enzyme required for sulfatase activity
VEATRREMPGCNTYDGEWRYQATASWQAPGFSQSADHPVACTSWSDAVAYAQWLSQKSGHAYRLPSASEWEYAARAGADSSQPWAPDASGACSDANVADQSAAQRFPGWNTFPCSDGYVNTAPVGSFKANAFGLNDLLGNVFEWVEDCWHPDYIGAPTDGSARRDGDCTEHELRGGSWFSSPRFVDASYRNRFETDYRSSAVGFRLVREVSR